MEFFGKWAKLFGWLVTGIIIPVTTWFVVLRSDVKAMQISILEHTEQVSEIKAGIIVDKDRLNLKLETIISELGQIKGELKRIK